MRIHQLSSTSHDEIFFDPNFLNLFESHISFLEKSNKFTLNSLDPISVYKYEGDLFGLLNSLGIEKRYHLLIMMFNNFRSPDELKQGISLIKIPNIDEIELIKNIYKSTTILM